MTKPPVIVYASRTCPPCRAVKEWLDSMGIKYIKSDPVPGLRVLPTVSIGTTTIEGFNRPLILETLTKYGFFAEGEEVR